MPTLLSTRVRKPRDDCLCHPAFALLMFSGDDIDYMWLNGIENKSERNIHWQCFNSKP